MTEWESRYKALRAAFIAWRKIERQNKKERIKTLQRYQNLVYIIKDPTSTGELRQQALLKLWDNLREHISAEMDD